MPSRNELDPEWMVHLVLKAYRDWKALVHINNKIVKKKRWSIGASSGPGSAVAGSTRRRVGKCHLGLTKVNEILRGETDQVA